MTATVTNKAAKANRDDDGVLVIGETVEEPKHDVLFRLRGKEYEGLTNPPGSLMLAYIGLLRKRGANVALSWLLEEMLTPEAYKAVTEDAAVSRADFRQVTDLVLGLLFGTETVPKSRRNG
jgi:hypothetical protein